MLTTIFLIKPSPSLVPMMLFCHLTSWSLLRIWIKHLSSACFHNVPLRAQLPCLLRCSKMVSSTWRRQKSRVSHVSARPVRQLATYQVVRNQLQEPLLKGLVWIDDMDQIERRRLCQRPAWRADNTRTLPPHSHMSPLEMQTPPQRKGHGVPDRLR